MTLTEAREMLDFLGTREDAARNDCAQDWDEAYAIVNDPVEAWNERPRVIGLQSCAHCGAPMTEHGNCHDDCADSRAYAGLQS